MKPKASERLQCIQLRKKGLSYSEILKYIPVSQSSLSLWLRNIKLSDRQNARLIKKGIKARKLGSIALRSKRILKSKTIIDGAISEIGNINKSDLMLIGTILYWAEGSKQKKHSPSKEVTFSNSDPEMIRVYLKWLKIILKIPNEKIVFEIYIHKSHEKTVQELARFWSGATGFPVSKFERVYFKKNKIHSFRKNRGRNYSGVLRVSVRKSTDLNRKIQGWIRGICIKSRVASLNEL